MVLELLLANHDRDCTTCEKSGVCKLQDLAQRMGVRQVRFGHREKMLPIDNSSPAIVRDPNKCILCGDCVRVCAEVQGIGVLDFINRGSEAVVSPAFGKNLADVDCVNCGQCASVCPTGALVVRSEIEDVFKAINDPSKVVVAQIAPAVRVAIGEEFGFRPGEVAMGQMVASLKKMGFDKVYDTSFTADLTVLEETHEFLERVQKGEHLPQFTSCCPAWVKYAEQYHPELLSQLSSCRSPQQMFGSVAKRFLSKQLGVKPQDLVVVSIMPCTAKKFEARRPEFIVQIDGVNVPDVDNVLTTQELARMIKEYGLDFVNLEPEPLDMPFGLSTGAGMIFGNSGGVAEAVLRAAGEMATGQSSGQVKFSEVRGLDGIREAEVDVAGNKVRLAVVHSLSNAKALLEKLAAGEVAYDLIEVMACPGGCIGGGGQPLPYDTGAKLKRRKSSILLISSSPCAKVRITRFCRISIPSG
jgi:NADH-quinone oxidoreductase subunit G